MKNAIAIILLLMLNLSVSPSVILARSDYFTYEWTYTGASVEEKENGIYEVGTPLAEFLIDEDVMVLTKITNIENVNNVAVKHQLFKDGEYFMSLEAAVKPVGTEGLKKYFAYNNFGNLNPAGYELKILVAIDGKPRKEVDSIEIKVLNLTSDELAVLEENGEANNDKIVPEVENRYSRENNERYTINEYIYNDSDIIIYPDRYRYWLYPGFYPAAGASLYGLGYYSGYYRGKKVRRRDWYLDNRPGRPDRPNRPNRPSRPERPDRPDRPNRPEKPDRPNRPANRPVNGAGKLDQKFDRQDLRDRARDRQNSGDRINNRPNRDNRSRNRGNINNRRNNQRPQNRIQQPRSNNQNRQIRRQPNRSGGNRQIQRQPNRGRGNKQINRPVNRGGASRGGASRSRGGSRGGGGRRR